MARMQDLRARRSARAARCLDSDRATGVLERRPALEGAFRACMRRVSACVLENPRLVGSAVTAVLLAKALENLGEHATGLVRNVAYLQRGDGIRGHPDVPDRGG